MKASEEYNKAFDKVKNQLPPIYIDTHIASKVLSEVKRFYLFLEFNPTGIYPRFLIRSKEATGDISDAITLTPNSNTIQIGYKRQDDLLDVKGVRFSKSKKVQRVLEYIKCDKSWMKWVVYKLKGLFTKDERKT